MKKLECIYCDDTAGGPANRVNTLLAFLSGGFIFINYIISVIYYLAENHAGNSWSMIVLTFLSSAAAALIMLAEPKTYGKYKMLNLAVHIMIVVCCSTLLFYFKTYMIFVVLFSTMMAAGLRLSIAKTVAISVVYSCVYTAAAAYNPLFHTAAVFGGIQVFVMFVSIVCLCRYISVLSMKKAGHEEVIAKLKNQKDSLNRELVQKNDDLEQTYWDMVNTLIGVIEARDNFTGGHSVKVCEYSVKLSRKLGLEDEDISKIMKASILHDIGKMGIPDNILLKSEALSCDEYGTIMTHPEIGCRILSRVRGLEDILPMILYHHERIDGTGYPYGISDKKIPLGARIIAIADAYDAMTSNRPYRKALVKKEAKKRLLEGSGTQFDADLVGSFMEIIDGDNVENIEDYRGSDIDRIRRYAGIM